MDTAGQAGGCEGLGELNNPITFPAVVQKVQTLVDGGLRVTFDLPEDAIMQAAELMAVRQAGYTVNVTVEPEKQVGLGGTTRHVEKGGKRQSNWKAAEE